MIKRWSILLLLLVGTAHARRHDRVPVLRAFPPSRASLLAQNAEIDKLDLPRIKTNAQLQEMVQSGDLVPLYTSRWITVASNLPKDRRYVKAWVNDFLIELGFEFYMRFDGNLQVNSAVRTVRVQRSLSRWNRNAAPAHGDTASSHLAGLTVDIARRGLTPDQITWIENYLLDLKDQVIVEEELKQPCFHICVRGNYKGATHETDSISVGADIGADTVGPE